MVRYKELRINHNRGQSSAFTIVELLVVIAIVAILATIVILSYSGWRGSVATSQVKSDLKQVAAAMQSEVTFNDTYPASIPSNFSASEGVTITLAEHSDTTFCVDGVSDDNPSIAYYVDQTLVDGEPGEGTCATRPADAPPSVPTDVQITSIGSTTINISWTASTGIVAEYKIQCAEDAGFIRNLKQSSSVTPSGSVTGANADTTQFCRVRASNSAGESAWSAVTSADTSQLSAPSGLVASSTTYLAITLGWNINADANSYSLQCATNTAFTTGVASTTVTAPTLTGTLSGLTPSTTYYCRINTVAAAGTSPWSSYITTATQAMPAPSGLASTSQTTSSVSWSFNAVSGAASYDVQLATDAGFTSLVGSANITTTTPTSTGLNPGVTYYYRVRSVPPSGPSSSWSSGVSAVTTMTGVSGLTVASQTTSSVTLSWTNNTAASSYVLYRATDSGFTQNVSGSAPTTGTTFTFSGLTHNTNYYFRIYATGAAGTNSAWSSPISTTTYTYIAYAGTDLLSTSGTIYHLMSSNNQYRLHVQGDGNVVVYRLSDNYPVWNKGSIGISNYRLSIQSDGNLVQYNASNSVVWQTNTNNTLRGGTGYYIILGDDGNLIIGDGLKATWSWMTGKIAPTNCNDINNETFRVMSRNSGKALDVEGASQSNGAKIQQWDYSGAAQQRWIVSHLGSNQYRITPSHSTGKTLDVNGPSMNDGTAIHQWDWLDTSNQKWYLQQTTSGYCNIVSVYSNKVVEIGGGSTANGAQVLQWAFTPPGTNHQQWIFQMP